jgi:hypothetical protein
MSLRAVALLVLALSPACSLPRSSVSAGDDAESATHAAPASPPLATPDASAPATPPPDAFTGAWATTYGRLRLQVAGRKVRGTYASGSTSGIVEGDVDGRVLRVAYEESTGVGGRARFNLSPDGSSFHGTWRPGARTDADLDTEPTSRWDGTRVVPVKDRVWLVVLEAYWQGGLHEPDYSYGEMLGAFFERLPDVEFRQRFFSGPIDFERLAGECAELEEPVILYVSSHGGPAEIFAPGGSVTGEVIARAVRTCGSCIWAPAPDWRLDCRARSVIPPERKRASPFRVSPATWTGAAARSSTSPTSTSCWSTGWTPSTPSKRQDVS